MGQSLKLSTEGIQKANEALANSFVTKSDLAAHISASRGNKKGACLKNTTGISRTTIDEFFDGSPKSAKVFKEICAALKLKWQEVAVLPIQTDLKPTKLFPVSDQTLADSSYTRDIDALVQQVRSRLLPFITSPDSPIGTMRMLSVNRPVPVDKIYIDLNVLEQLSCTSHFSGWRQKFDPNNREEFDRLSLSRVKKERKAAIQVVKEHRKLMVVGKPGAGKTTFLKSLAVACIQPETEVFADLVPLFVTLREFANFEKEARKTESWKLLDYLMWLLADQWKGCGRASAEKILTEGRSLVLLDGLDEVPPEDLENAINAVKEFGYRSNRLVITCRTQSQQYLDGFTDVEAADFTPEQVERFVENWFKIVDSGSQASLAPQLKQQLRATENKPIAELTITPVLLNLVCVVFRDEQGNLPKKRFQLYTKGMRHLLERIEGRTPIDERLTIDVKENFLAELAVMLFEKNDYFPEQQTLEKFIRNYFDVERSVATKILKAFETETGLLIERSVGYWSFSHLTFQEYFIAKWFCSQPDCKNLVKYIQEKRWREVFLLTVEALNDASQLLQMIKDNIDIFLKPDIKTQNFLSWLNQKACSVKNTYNPVTRSIEGKPAAIRAFYFDLALVHKNGFANQLYQNILSKFSNNFGSCEPADYRLASEFELSCAVDSSLAPYLHFASDLAFVGADDLAIDAAIDSNIEFVYGCILDSEFRESIRILKDQLPTENGIDRFEKWKQLNGIAWAEQLRSVVVKYRNGVGYDWQLNEKQKQLLLQYYYGNKLLMDCLNSDCVVHDDVRQEIEKTLLLPSAEIEKLKGGHEESME